MCDWEASGGRVDWRPSCSPLFLQEAQREPGQWSRWSGDAAAGLRGCSGSDGWEGFRRQPCRGSGCADLDGKNCMRCGWRTLSPPLPAPRTAAESRLAEAHARAAAARGGGGMARVRCGRDVFLEGEEGRRGGKSRGARHRAQPDWWILPRSQPRGSGFRARSSPPPSLERPGVRWPLAEEGGAGILLSVGCKAARSLAACRGLHCSLGGLIIVSVSTSFLCLSSAFCPS